MLFFTGIILLVLASIPYIFYLAGIYIGKKQSPSPPVAALPPVSIIISAYNEGVVIEKRVDNIKDSTYPMGLYEIIFVDDSSDDDTGALAEKYLSMAGISHKVIRNERRLGTNRSYNRALGETAFDIIVTTDADVFFANNALEKLVTRLVSDEGIAAVCADMYPVPDSETLNTTIIEEQYRNFYGRMCGWESEIDSTYNFNGGLVAFKKDIFDQILEGRGADDANTAFESIRRGYRAFYELESVVYEVLPISVSVQRRQKIRRATRLIEATLANLDVLRINRPFSRRFYPMRIIMYIATPSLFFAGAFILILSCILMEVGVLSLAIILIIALSAIPCRHFVLSFIMNQVYLLSGLLRLGKDVSIWDSRSKTTGK